jgi:hypothetical protein
LISQLLPETDFPIEVHLQGSILLIHDLPLIVGDIFLLLASNKRDAVLHVILANVVEFIKVIALCLETKLLLVVHDY